MRTSTDVSSCIYSDEKIQKSEIQGLKLLLPVEREFRNYRRLRQINRRLDPRRNDTTT